MAWSRFYGILKGRAQTVATRIGTAESAMSADLLTTTGGIKVYLFASRRDPNVNAFSIYLTPHGDSNFLAFELCHGEFTKGGAPVLKSCNSNMLDEYVAKIALAKMREDV